MAVETPRKPKRVVQPSEALRPEQTDQILKSDPMLSSLMQTASPTCTKVSASARQKQIEDDARRRRQSAIASETNGKNGTWAFVKNQNVKEQITFKDGSKFQFPDTLFVTKDKELAEKLQAVSETFNICLK
jgi:hypothetical protein